MTEGIKYRDIDKLIYRVKEEHVEVELIVEPDRQQLTVRPWKPYEFSCPYKRSDT